MQSETTVFVHIDINTMCTTTTTWWFLFNQPFFQIPL